MLLNVCVCCFTDQPIRLFANLFLWHLSPSLFLSLCLQLLIREKPRTEDKATGDRERERRRQSRQVIEAREEAGNIPSLTLKRAKAEVTASVWETKQDDRQPSRLIRRRKSGSRDQAPLLLQHTQGMMAQQE